MRIKYFISLLSLLIAFSISDVTAQSKKAEKTKKQTERHNERQKRKEDRQLKRDIRAHKKKQTPEVQKRMTESRKKAQKFNKDNRDGFFEKWKKKRKLNKR